MSAHQDEAENEELQEAACVVIRHCLRQHRDWAVRLNIMHMERQWTTAQVLAACVGYVMEHELHMEVPYHPLFDRRENEALPPEECSRCGGAMQARWQGQAWHTPECPPAEAVA